MILSIIIPVYNVEKFIEKNLSSICSQVRDSMNIEIIVVNDGTKDNSMSIVKLYEKKIKKFSIINQENQGLSVARNTGLDAAQGEYVWFVDSDDWLLQDAINKVIETIDSHKGVDVIATRLLHHKEWSGNESIEKFPNMSAKTGKEYLFGNNLIGASPRYILRRNFLIENNLRFMPDVYHEDGEFGYRMMYLAQSCYILPNPVYVYRLRSEGSIMSSRKPKMNTDLIKIYGSLLKFADIYVNREDYWSFRAYIITCLWNSILFSRKQIFTEDFKCFYKQHKKYIHNETALLLRHLKHLTTSQILAALHYYFFPLTWTKLKRVVKICKNKIKNK